MSQKFCVESQGILERLPKLTLYRIGNKSCSDKKGGIKQTVYNKKRKEENGAVTVLCLSWIKIPKGMAEEIAIRK